MASFAASKVTKRQRVALDLKTKLQLVKEFENSRLTQKSLAIKYGIGKSTVGDILRHYRTRLRLEDEEDDDEESNGSVDSRHHFAKRRKKDDEVIPRERHYMDFDDLPMALENGSEDGVWFSEEPPIETILTEEPGNNDGNSSSTNPDLQRVPCIPTLVVGYRLKDILKPNQLMDVTRKVYSSLKANEIPLISKELLDEDCADNMEDDGNDGFVGVDEAYTIAKSLRSFMLNSLPEGLPYVRKCEEILEKAVKSGKKFKQTTLHNYYKPAY